MKGLLNLRLVPSDHYLFTAMATAGLCRCAHAVLPTPTAGIIKSRCYPPWGQMKIPILVMDMICSKRLEAMVTRQPCVGFALLSPTYGDEAVLF